MTPREFASRAGRTELDTRVELKAGDDAFQGTSKNIGLGGLFVATERTLRVGERLALTFTLPEQARSVAVRAEVRWVRQGSTLPAGIGLRFVNPPVAATVAIHEFLRRRDEDRTPR